MSTDYGEWVTLYNFLKDNGDYYFTEDFLIDVTWQNNECTGKLYNLGKHYPDIIDSCYFDDYDDCQDYVEWCLPIEIMINRTLGFNRKLEESGYKYYKRMLDFIEESD